MMSGSPGSSARPPPAARRHHAPGRPSPPWHRLPGPAGQRPAAASRRCGPAPAPRPRSTASRGSSARSPCRARTRGRPPGPATFQDAHQSGGTRRQVGRCLPPRRQGTSRASTGAVISRADPADRGFPRLTGRRLVPRSGQDGFPAKLGRIGQDWRLLRRRAAARHDRHLRDNCGSLTEADLGRDPDDAAGPPYRSSGLTPASRENPLGS